jgi:hypothetical protein
MELAARTARSFLRLRSFPALPMEWFVEIHEPFHGQGREGAQAESMHMEWFGLSNPTFTARAKGDESMSPCAGDVGVGRAWSARGTKGVGQGPYRCGALRKQQRDPVAPLPRRAARRFH